MHFRYLWSVGLLSMLLLFATPKVLSLVKGHYHTALGPSPSAAVVSSQVSTGGMAAVLFAPDSPDKYTFHAVDVSDSRGSVVKYTVSSSRGDVVTWAKALPLLARGGDSHFTTSFIAVLQDFPHPAFFFECPPLTRASARKRPFEFILRDSPALARITRADVDAFSEYTVEDANVFENLGGDAVLVAPKGLLGEQHLPYAHLAGFVRGAPAQQVQSLWAKVGSAMEQTLMERGRQPTWLSTSGLGVYWLHVRLDSRPKYYTYMPYKQASP